MPSQEPLSQEEIDQALKALPGWSFQDETITKTFELKNFRAAVSFIVRMAFAAEELNHHPNLQNVYNQVTISLTTHDAGNKVTEMDLALARKIEEFSWV